MKYNEVVLLVKKMSKDKKLNDLYYNGTVKKSKYFNKIIRRNNGV